MKIARHIFRLESERQPELIESPVERTAARQHSDHGIWFSVEQDLTAHHCRIRAELRNPQHVAENRDVLLPALILTLGAQTSGPERL